MSLIRDTEHHVRHFTVTGYVTNPGRTKILMIHHNKLQKWLPAGGHLEENELPHEGAIREVFEETGIRAKVVADPEVDLGLEDVVDVQIPRPCAMTYQIIPANAKEAEHIHIDLMYHLEADDNKNTVAELTEVSEIAWMTKSQVLTSKDVFDSVKGFVKAALV